VLDFNGAMEGQEQDKLILRVRGDRMKDLAQVSSAAAASAASFSSSFPSFCLQEVARIKAATESTPLSSRGALPSFRVKDNQTPLKTAAKAATAATTTTTAASAVSPQVQPQTASGGSSGASPIAAAVAAAPLSGALTAPPTTFVSSKSGRAKEPSAALVEAGERTPLVVVDKFGNERDGWEVFGEGAARDRSEARLKRQRDKEARQRARDKAKEGRNVRLDEDKGLFLESLERSMKQLVPEVDESSLRRPEELTDAEILGLQKRAYRWKRENRLLRELLYTQYVIAQKK